jgi:2-amino-4-hydroxy-6-hydroxymethyldihydropteridine diphosphokinase
LILIALGANLPSRYGNPEQTLEAAKAELERRGIAVLKSSATIVSSPVPVSDQPDYRNAVISVATKLGPQALHDLLKISSGIFGRKMPRGMPHACSTSIC